jgi:RND family efflux transporter MFP subunit
MNPQREAPVTRRAARRWALSVLGASSLLAACGAGGAEEPLAGAGGPAGPPAIPVGIAAVEPTQVQDATEYIATLKAVSSTSVRPQVEGHIVRVFVRSGDRVKPGSQILQIDPARQEASLMSQEASVAVREADLAYAQQQFDRLQDLYAQRIVSKAELDQAEAALKTSEAAVAALRAQAREQRVQLQYYLVLSPTSGIVGDIPVRVGDRITTDTEITTIVSNDQLEVLVPVPSERAADLRVGLPLELLGEDGRVVVEAKADFISPRVDGTTQSVLVKATIRNPAGQLRSQQFVRTRVIWSSGEGITVPVLAVTRVSGQAFVFVAEQQDGREVARQRPVRLGAISGEVYAVLDGVKAGDRIVVSGVQKLADGVPISPTQG